MRKWSDEGNYHSLDEIQQHKPPLHVYILLECGVSSVKSAHLSAIAETVSRVICEPHSTQSDPRSRRLPTDSCAAVSQSLLSRTAIIVRR
ncbi:hypothetical protein EVAR_100476_1 [Eumeta japonica]|uniref:Uncharacterized protein n=1 Tax=Eumeta variegata TaxID=151549 RepID=A0A4C1SE59_EUMVA|nr:hypothetical protein EVAR_100476_1 [Eumeta japonica]